MNAGHEKERTVHRLNGFFRLIEKILLIAIPISGIAYALGIHIYLRQILYRQQYLAFFLGLVLASIFLVMPAKRGTPRYRLPWYDVVLAGASLGIGLFVFVVYPGYLLTGIVHAGPEYAILGVLNILLVIEATRRVSGWVLVGLVGLCLFYGLFTWLFPGPFYGKGIPWDELSIYLFVDSSGILGIPLWVSGGIIFGFILLGQALAAIGGSQLLNNFALASFGRFRGGPAKMAVLASSFFGTISGSAVSNVAATGVMTIPLMKKTGYKPAVAGAIEAAASTGGALAPPVMGITAFLIAEFLSIPYSKVAFAALLPAILYYLALFIQVDLEAAKSELKGLTGELPSLRPVLKKSWILIIPLIVLVYTLFILNWQPGLSAVSAFTTVLILSFFTKETRIGLLKFVSLLEGAGRGMLMIGAITASAGIVIGVVYFTGVASILSFILVKIGGQNLFLMLVITAMISLILGMGLPGSAIYIILAVLIAPSLVQLGVVPLAAHLFITYFGLMSLVTPPVCFAGFAAAAIAESSTMETGFYSVRFAIAAYIVPFIFVYSPGLIFEGTARDFITVAPKSFVAIGLLSIGITGFLFRKLSPVKRILLCLGAVCLAIPSGLQFPIAPWLLNMAGLALSLPLIVWEYWKSKSGHDSSDEPLREGEFLQQR